jgi:rhamnosyltransferase
LKAPILICLFVHFNRSKKLEQNVITYLEHLEDAGFKIIFISNSSLTIIDQTVLQTKIKDITVFQRENRGADFGAWKWVMDNKLMPEDFDYLLLTNDSVYGPLFPIRPIIQSMQENSEIDFWGLTDNYQGGWHLQSYFLFLSKKVFNHNAFLAVFEHDFSKDHKLEIIKKGEILLTKALLQAGFNGAAFAPYKKISPDIEEWAARNSTHFYWDILIEKLQFPFVKKELVLQNPENIQSISNLFPLIEKYSSYPIENIKQSISEYLFSFDSPPVFSEKISVICHLFYAGSIYYFLSRLMSLKSPHTQFVFNLSASLFYNSFFCEMLTQHFPGAFIIFTPNQGRDIGGKLAAFDSLMKSGVQSDFTIIIHDKFSPHTPTGTEWRDKLLKIINPKVLPEVLRKFQNPKVGVITTEELIKNEWDPDRERFSCTSSENILNYIKKFGLQVSDYKFAAGTIFWIKTSILKEFFSSYPAIAVRKELEKGNALDFDKGTNIHAWERLFSFVANSQGYKTIGV